jgi:hypothetical protein
MEPDQVVLTEDKILGEIQEREKRKETGPEGEEPEFFLVFLQKKKKNIPCSIELRRTIPEHQDS